MPTDNISAALRTLTAFDSLTQLQRHVHENKGKAPSFRSDNLAGVALANALLSHGIVCTVWE